MSVGYAIQSISPLEYAFTTQHSVRYRTWFKPTGYLFEGQAWADSCFEFVVRNVADSVVGPAGLDDRIPPTIADVLLNFFELGDYVVLYSCETSDGRGAARARKFHGWFRQFNDDRFVKADHALFDPKRNQTYHSSVLLRANHPQRDEILAAFEALFGGLEAEK